MRLAALMMAALAAPPALAAQDGSLVERLRAALELPVRATEAREAGVPDERVQGTIWDIFRSRVPAGEAADILDAEVRTVREGAPRDNFGAYVRSQVQSGLRGRELADAIHREQERRGMRRGGARRGGGGDVRPGEPDARGGAEPRGNASGRGRRGDAAGADTGQRGPGDARPNQGRGAGRGRQP